MNIDPRYIILLDYNADDIPKSVKILKPVLFHKGDVYSCLLGPDSQEGIFGCGQTVKEALADWNNNLRERVMAYHGNDAFVQDIIENLKKYMHDLW